MVPFTQCEPQAAGILTGRMAEPDFRDRLEDSSTSWRIDFPVFLRQVQGIIAVALFNAHRDSPDLPPAQATGSALSVLRDTSPPELLFVVLPADLGESTALMKDLRLLSASRTAGPALLWERLAQTARNVLDASAVYPDEAHVVGPSQSSDRPFNEKTLSTGHDRGPH